MSIAPCTSLFLYRFSRDYKYELLGGTAVAGLLIGLYKWRQTKLLPPGPLGVPLIGSSLILKENLSDILAKLQQDYGDIVCIGTGLGGYVYIESIILQCILVNGIERVI